jgi:hypothetical protein
VYVGKNCPQVGRNNNDRSIFGRDAEVFDKWSQALASASHLVYEAAVEGKKRNDLVISLVLPVLVVPDGMLWQTNYAANGTKNDDPVKTDRCSFFVDQNYVEGFPLDVNLTISHIEFVTLSGLEELMKGIFESNNLWFPTHTIFQNWRDNSPSTASSIGKSLEQAGRSTQLW